MNLKKFILILIFSFSFIFPACSEININVNKIVIAELNGAVGVQMENFVNSILNGDCDLIIFQLDTPGGLAESMRLIVQNIINSKIPVVIWVNGRAASAGAFIVQAGGVAAMSSGSNIGAAHPVSISGGDVKDEMSRKLLNDIKAQMRSIVQLRGRNQNITEKMIDESISLTAQEALNNGVIDLIADDLNSLIAGLSGRIIKNGSNYERLILSGKLKILKINMSLKNKILQLISDPSISYLLISAGIFAIILEIIIPGGFMFGTLGAIMLLFGAIGLKIFPFEWFGIIFTGSIFALTLCLFLALLLILKSRTNNKISTGFHGMENLRVKILTDINQYSAGQVMCHGEIWRAKSDYGTIKAGESGRVKKIDDMTLIIGRF